MPLCWMSARLRFNQPQTRLLVGLLGIHQRQMCTGSNVELATR